MFLLKRVLEELERSSFFCISIPLSVVCRLPFYARLKKLDIEIVLECQTKAAYPNCEYCIASKSCLIREGMESESEKKLLRWLPKTQ